MRARAWLLTSSKVTCRKPCAIIFACWAGRPRTTAKRSTSTKWLSFSSLRKSTGATQRSISLREAFARIENWNPETVESTLKNLAQKLGCKTGDLVHPARVAVSGRSVGPSLYHMLEVMGKERVLARFDRMISQLGAE